MKNLRLIISSFLLYLLNIGFESRVQANYNEILPSFIDDLEIRRDLEALRDAEIRRRNLSSSVEHEKAEFPEFRRKSLKKKKKASNHKKAWFPNNSVKLAEKKKKNRKKIKRVKSNRRFVKTTLVDRDSKISDSKDSDSKGKPVDIIVHIKMND